MPLDSGTKLGQYEISDTLGVGGMGEVYRARDARLGRAIALKVLPQSFARDAERCARFEREAKVLASLNHPHIAAIYGYEDSDRGLALVMELVEGPTLAAQIAKGPIPVSEALLIAKQIADGLEYAHERGIVHRDLKPANVKLTSDGSVKILDFGLAKAVEAEINPKDISSSPTLSHMATQAGMILGTAAYMSPEQAKGKSVDRRADIWAFGCVVFELLTGKPTFAGETVTDVLAAVVRAEPDWSLLPSATPSHVRVLLRRCLQKDSRHRLRDIGDARISLEEVLSGTQESFSSAGISFPLARRVVPWTLAGLILGAIIAGFFVRRFVTPAVQSSMHFSAVTNFAGVQALPAISPDGRSIAFVSNRDGHYDIYVGLMTGGTLVQITNDSALKGRPAWSPDGTSIAYARLNSSGIWDIWIVPSLGGNSRRLILNATDPTWSPDGASLAYENGADAAIWTSNVAGENAHRLVTPSGAEPRETQPRFSPDGRRLVFSARNDGPYGEIEIADLSTGAVRRLTSDGALAVSPAWSLDERFIYFCSSRGGTMNIWKIPSAGGVPEQITAGQGDDAQLDLSADGKRVVFSTWRMNTNIAQLDVSANSTAQTAKLLTTDPGRNQVAPMYSPDGAHIAYFSNLKGTEKEGIWVSNADGSNPVQLVRDSLVDIYPNWAPDSQHVVYEAQTVQLEVSEYRVASISGGSPETLFRGDINRLFDIVPDGRLLYRDDKNQVVSLDPRDKQPQIVGTITGGTIEGPVRGSPDGKSVAYIVSAGREGDPKEGVWVTDFKNPPRQVYRGWVCWWLARGSRSDLFFVVARPDLTGELWKVGWGGQGLTRLSAKIPMIQSYWVDPTEDPQDHFAISPDGRHIAFEQQTVLSANIGMIENVR